MRSRSGARLKLVDDQPRIGCRGTGVRGAATLFHGKTLHERRHRPMPIIGQVDCLIALCPLQQLQTPQNGHAPPGNAQGAGNEAMKRGEGWIGHHPLHRTKRRCTQPQPFQRQEIEHLPGPTILDIGPMDIGGIFSERTEHMPAPASRFPYRGARQIDHLFAEGSGAPGRGREEIKVIGR